MTNPEYFELKITDKVILMWQSILFSNKFFDSFSILNNPNTLEFSHTKINENDRVLICDIIRTRVKERNKIDNYESFLKHLIESYLANEKITYKQGLNEIFGLFLLLKSYLPNLSISNIYNLSAAFIKKFLANFYSNNDSIYALKSSFIFTNLLLRYHDPEIYIRLKENDIRIGKTTTLFVASRFLILIISPSA